MQPSLALNLRSSCLGFLSAGMLGLPHHVWISTIPPNPQAQRQPGSSTRGYWRTEPQALCACALKSLGTAFLIFIFWSYQKINFSGLRLENVICYISSVHRAYNTPHTRVICCPGCAKGPRKRINFLCGFLSSFPWKTGRQ